MNTLLEILRLKRPHGGANERFVAENILRRLNTDTRKLQVYYNNAGKPMCYFMCTDPESRTLFSAHLDTVHHDECESNPIIFDRDMMWIHKEDGTALGADDGAGVWLLYKMIEAGIPGTYLFPLGEECGGIGSKWLAASAPDFLEQFDRAIAFDRKGQTDIITFQRSGRCCSDEFAEALALKLNTELGEEAETYKPCDGGVYTDTAEFIQLISECTNVSCGYRNEHRGQETLDVQFLENLLNACLSIQWETLPAARNPKVFEPKTYKYDNSWQDWKSGDNDWRGWDQGLRFGQKRTITGNTIKENNNSQGIPTLYDTLRERNEDEVEVELDMTLLAEMSDADLEEFVYGEPEAVLEFLCAIRDRYIDKNGLDQL